MLEPGHLGKRSGEAPPEVLESSRHTLGSAHRVNLLGSQAEDTERPYANDVGLPRFIAVGERSRAERLKSKEGL